MGTKADFYNYLTTFGTAGDEHSSFSEYYTPEEINQQQGYTYNYDDQQWYESPPAPDHGQV